MGCCFFFPFVFVFSGGYGEKESLGDPHYDARRSLSGGRKWVYLQKPAVALRGSGNAAAIVLRALQSAGWWVQDDK